MSDSITRFSPLREAMESAQGVASKDPVYTKLPDDWVEIARRRKPEPQVRVTLAVDADVAAFFRGLGRGHQSRMNDVLRAFMIGVEAGYLPVVAIRAPRNETSLDREKSSGL